jgi:hypothetical protein
MSHLLKAASGHILKKPSGHLAITPNQYWSVRNFTVTWTGSYRYRFINTPTWTYRYESGTYSGSFLGALTNPASSVRGSYLNYYERAVFARYYGPSSTTTPDTLRLAFGTNDNNNFFNEDVVAVITSAGLNYEGAVSVTWVKPSTASYLYESTIDDVYFEPTSFW